MLMLNANYTIAKGNENTDSYTTTYHIGYGPKDIREQGNSSAEKDNTNTLYSVLDLYATFNKDFGKHSVSAVLGYNQEYNRWDQFSARRNNIISTSLPSIALSSGDQFVNESYRDWAIRGVFFRANYTYDNRYIFELDGRYDGSSRFPKNKRFGFFPSGSVAWRVDSEKFFRPLHNLFSQFKLRGSYGSLGNQLVSEYGYVPSMTYAPGAGIYIQSLNKSFSGYHQIKGFINNKDENYYLSIDYPVIRYAEVLLIYAEARAERGELTQQDLDQSINLIKSRAGMPKLVLNPVADPVMQAAFPGISPVLLEIRRERRVELAFEGFRFDDLMRWKAGKLLEKEPEGLYFPALGKYDLTGDGVPDIYLIPSSESIPAEENKESNSLGVKLIYYKTGTIDDPNATVYLTGGTKGNILTIKDMGTFVEPQYYYRPVPKHQMDLNPKLGPQLFGWK